MAHLPNSRRGSPTANYDILEDKDKMLAMYQWMTMEQMSIQLHCSKRTIREWLAGHGIEIRPKRQPPPMNGAQKPRADEKKRGGWHPRSAAERLRVSYWRMCILAEQCPFMCPDYPCDRLPVRPDDGRSGCTMYNRLKNMGELTPRQWEGSDPWEHWRAVAETRDYGPDELGEEDERE